MKDIGQVFETSIKRATTFKKTVTIKLDQRLLLHLEDLKTSPTKLIDTLIRMALQTKGIDTTKPHPREIHSYEEGTHRFVTYDEYWKSPERYDEDGQAVMPPGSPYGDKVVI